MKFYPDDFFACLFVDFLRRDGLLDVAENHVQMLVVGMELAAELSVTSALDVYPFVKTEPV